VGPSSRFSLNGMDADLSPVSLAYLPPTSPQVRSACAGAIFLLLGFAVLAPFAHIPMPIQTTLGPDINAMYFVIEVITASLLLAHFSLTRSRALLALAFGYLISAANLVVLVVTSPTFTSPRGNLHGNGYATFCIYLLWHLGLPGAIFAYVWLRDEKRTKGVAHISTGFASICGFAGILALASYIARVIVANDAVLPTIMIFKPPLDQWLTFFTLLICAAALTVLWVFRRSVLDQWLMLVMLAAMVELAIAGRLFGGPNTLGFYSGHVILLVTFAVVLAALFGETTSMYAGLARANLLASVVKASQALSSEIALTNLVERLMQIVLEYAGADRGLLILPAGDDFLIQAEACATGDEVEVAMRQAPIAGVNCPESLIRYVVRSKDGVVLGDASADKVYSKDEYVRQKGSRSVLCLPIVRQTKVVGALYLEDNLTPGVFTPDRATVLQLLASQAAISLENAALYTDLQRSEAFLAQGQKISHTGSFGRNVLSEKLYWSEETYEIYELDRSVEPTLEWLIQRIHPEDRVRVQQTIESAIHQRTGFDIEYRLLTRSASVKYLHVVVQAQESASGELEFVGAVTDVTERMRAEEALRQALGDLARINRVTTMGELTASLAHEISQPISGAITNANVCLRILGNDKPDLDEVRAAVTRFGRDARRAAEIVARIRSQFEKGALNRKAVDVNETIRETVALLRGEAVRHNALVRTELAADLPQIVGDRVQLQQVAMNLILNSIEAMKDVDGIRELVIKSQRAENEQILMTVSDTGPGFPPQLAEQIFDPFFTTKPHGTGMGLRISRSIIESHGGRLWAEGASGRGATFHLNLPAAIPGH
jgi:signal transduction histidine kinase